MTKKDGTRGAVYSGDTLGDRMKHYERDVNVEDISEDIQNK